MVVTGRRASQGSRASSPDSSASSIRLAASSTPNSVRKRSRCGVLGAPRARPKFRRLTAGDSAPVPRKRPSSGVCVEGAGRSDLGDASTCRHCSGSSLMLPVPKGHRQVLTLGVLVCILIECPGTRRQFLGQIPTHRRLKVEPRKEGRSDSAAVATV